MEGDDYDVVCKKHAVIHTVLKYDIMHHNSVGALLQ